MTLLVGLDIGTTTIKAAAYDPEAGQVVSLASRPTPTSHPEPGWSEHDPQALWEAAAACLCEVGTGHPHGAVKALAIASMAEAGVPIDAAGNALYPAIAWYDRRSELQAARWDEQISPSALHAITGQRVSASFGVNKWLWIRENVPDVAARLAIWLPLPGYILWRLTGERVTDYSIASRTLLFDQASLRWSPALLDRAGLSPAQLPHPLPAGVLAGALTAEAARATALPVGTICGLGGHDHLCAALAAGGYRPDAAIDSCGTAEAVLALTPAFVSTPAMAAAGFACYAHVVPGQYVIKAGLKAAGGAIEWLARQLAGPATPADRLPYQALAEAAAQGVGRRAGPLWLPHLIGSGTPEGDTRGLAAMVGGRAEHDAGDLFRGLLESLAFWLRHNLETLQELTEGPIAEIGLLGGTTRLALLSQLKADVLGRPVVVPQLPEAAAIGAALLAGLAAGCFCSASEAVGSLRYPSRTLEPDPRRVPWYDRLYREAYRPLYAALHDVHRALAGM